MLTLILPHFLRPHESPLNDLKLPAFQQFYRHPTPQAQSTADLYQRHLCDQLTLPPNTVYASPLCQQIGMNSISAQHGNPLAITANEAQTLCEGLNQLYQNDAHFQAIRPDLWQIQFKQTIDWQIENIFNLNHLLEPDNAPSHWLQIATETQMWLHSHPINQNRTPCPINSLWIWNAPKPQTIHPHTQIATDSAWISHSSQNTTPLPEHFSAWQNHCQHHHIALSETALFSEAFIWANDTWHYQQTLHDWEQRFFAPIVHAIHSGSLKHARIICEQGIWQLNRLSAYAFWKHRPPFNGTTL